MNPRLPRLGFVFAMCLWHLWRRCDVRLSIETRVFNTMLLSFHATDMRSYRPLMIIALPLVFLLHDVGEQAPCACGYNKKNILIWFESGHLYPTCSTTSSPECSWQTSIHDRDSIIYCVNTQFPIVQTAQLSTGIAKNIRNKIGLMVMVESIISAAAVDVSPCLSVSVRSHFSPTLGEPQRINRLKRAVFDDPVDPKHGLSVSPWTLGRGVGHPTMASVQCKRYIIS